MVGVGLAVGGLVLRANLPYHPQFDASPWTLVDQRGYDPTIFTEGLAVLGERLVVTHGDMGLSKLLLIDPSNGSAIRSVDMPSLGFAEGIAVVGDELWTLTWRGRTLHRWDHELRHLGLLRYRGIGWGLCHDTDSGVLWRSDGSGRLTAHSTTDFTPLRHVEVDADRLNELEYAGGLVWANVWGTPWVLAIDPGSGSIAQAHDLTDLVERAAAAQGSPLSDEQVLNGLAHDPATGNFFVTGKRWPVMFNVNFE